MGFVYWYIIILVPILGVCVGSFLNVLIYRIPEGEEVVKTSSHCKSCGTSLRWYDNIPLLSYIILKGRCRYCGERISLQYPLVELLNTVLWCIILYRYGVSIDMAVFCLMSSALVVLSIIDERTYTIPNSVGKFLLVLGVLITVIDYTSIVSHLVGACCVSSFLFIVYMITRGNGLGFGDIKLMFVCGLIVGWKNIVVAFFVGCILAIVVHSLRMYIGEKSSKLAFGPYLSVGVYVSLFVGELLIDRYISFIGGIV